jgi:hypothetical protein
MILLTVLILTNLFFLYRSYSFAKKNIQLVDLLEQLSNTPSKEEKDEMNESFLKFVSDSREWAFRYIEDVQKGLNNFIKSIDKDIEYFDKFGDIVANNPNTEILKRISISYKELKKLLPEETNN